MSDWFVVLEFNQASGQPNVAMNGDVYDEAADAETDAAGMLERTLLVGRRERYAVARLTDVDELA